MTPKISLIIGIAVTALAFGVPTALGERQLVGPPATLAQRSDSPAHLGDSPATAAFYTDESVSRTRQEAMAAFRASEGATLALSDSPTHLGDSPATAAFYTDESVSRTRQEAMAAFRASEGATLVEQASSGVGSRDEVRLDPNNVPSPAVSGSSGSEIEWPQLGIGFGLGILLVVGLWLAMRMTKVRGLAH